MKEDAIELKGVSRGDVGEKLKSTQFWDDKVKGTDEYGFCEVPSGEIFKDKDYDGALFTCNLTLNATIADSGINNIVQLHTASLANAEETCELNVGQSIGNCLIWMVMGPAQYYFSFNTANCNSYCDPAGTNCCYGLNL